MVIGKTLEFLNEQLESTNIVFFFFISINEMSQAETIKCNYCSMVQTQGKKHFILSCL